jgi:hypothetical protein
MLTELLGLLRDNASPDGPYITKTLGWWDFGRDRSLLGLLRPNPALPPSLLFISNVSFAAERRVLKRPI